MRIAGLVALFAGNAVAAPFIVSDAYTTGTMPTHCTYQLDGGARVPDIPVESTASGPRCKFDIASVTTGTHTMIAYAVVNDSAYGRQESPASVPFVFTPSGRPSAPNGLRITP